MKLTKGRIRTVSRIGALSIIMLAFPGISYAHCPLCTAGAGVLAIAAASLGVSSTVVGVMIGAFALALSLWVARLPKKKYLPYQYQLLAALVFIGTVVPIMPLIRDYSSIYIPFIGQYGTTYMYDQFLVGSIIGAVIVYIAPMASKFLTKLRSGKQMPYQGIALTFILLLGVSLLIQFVP